MTSPGAFVTAPSLATSWLTAHAPRADCFQEATWRHSETLDPLKAGSRGNSRRLPMAASASMLVGCGAIGYHRRRFTGSRKRRSSFRQVAVFASRGNQEAPLCRVARGLPPLEGPQVPVWVFRQAGRHLPEYNEYKAAKGKNFLQILQDPEDVAEVTLQPLRRYGVDAAILFSDILVVVEALGIRLDMPGGKGITVLDPLECPDDLGRLPEHSEAVTAEFIEARLGHVLQAIRKILAKMVSEGFGSRPLIGFSAAPWTLFFYMVGGSSTRRTDAGERWLVEHQAASKELFSLLTGVVIEYLSAQVREGCHVLQVFEAMGEHISQENFQRWALPAMAEIAAELRQRHPDVPLMVFPRGASYSLADLQTAGYDVVTADCSTDLGEAALMLRAAAARSKTGRVATLQGNFDPKWLRPSEGSTAADVQREVLNMLASLDRVQESPHLIANLGEGLNGTESPELVAAFVDAVHASTKGGAKQPMS